MIDKTGAVMVDFDYDSIMSLHNANLFRAEKEDKSSVIDGTGNIIVPFLYDDVDVTLLDEGGSVIYGKLNGSKTFYSFEGEVLEVECITDGLRKFDNSANLSARFA